jgi:hypothetical protein
MKMNGIEAYNASSTCVCGGVPLLVDVDGKKQIKCGSCGCAGPTDSRTESAIRGWNINIEALTTYMTVVGIMKRDNPKLATILDRQS